MFREAGFACHDYDPFYRDDPALLTGRYDFVAATEGLEHLAEPAGVLHRLLSLLRPGGWLGVMTKRVTSEDAFARWHYIRDPTHIAFFCDDTFAWIAEHYRVAVHIESADVVLLRTAALP
jgi:2-polyprenyl-3-methyl-5-hydroxy-6-metoxy-1,4-benzoquinol methylase